MGLKGPTGTFFSSFQKKIFFFYFSPCRYFFKKIEIRKKKKKKSRPPNRPFFSLPGPQETIFDLRVALGGRHQECYTTTEEGVLKKTERGLPWKLPWWPGGTRGGQKQERSEVEMVRVSQRHNKHVRPLHHTPLFQGRTNRFQIRKPYLVAWPKK